MRYKDFELYPFQEEAIASIRAGRSVIVSAPTGAGKTIIAEYAIEQAIADGNRIVYTSPIKALSNQKYRDFRGSYGDAIGIMTGDVTLNPDAAVLIMTTEIFRNTIFESPERLAGIRFVVMDEVHYLGDDERGTVWEESLIFAPEAVRFICLSATIANLDQFRTWIEKVRSAPCDLVRTEKRPVPLTHHAFIPESGIARISDLKVLIPEARRARRKRSRRQQNVLDHIQREGILPCLSFSFSRRECEARARANQRRNLLSAAERDEILRLFDDLAGRYEIAEHRSAAELRQLASRGILYHHAGMLPVCKEIVERLFTSGLVKMLFTTETFALGVNMPARTVVFNALRKFDGVGFDYLTTLQYYQMAGRAGRQGIDRDGQVFSVINPEFDDARAVKRVIFGKVTPIRSKFNLSYSTILSLWDRLREGIFEAVGRSFAAFQRGGSMEKERAAVEKRLAVLERRGYIAGGELTERGRLALRINGYEIAVTELFFDGAFEDLDAIQTAILITAIVFEPRRGELQDRLELDALGPAKNRARKRIEEFRRLESSQGITDPIRSLDFGLSAAVNAWARGAAFEDLASFTASPDGDLVRNFRLAVQLLRQFAHAMQGYESQRARAFEALNRMNRDVVDAERQLRLG